MHYMEDRELSLLLDRSEELSRRSKAISETCALQSASLRELLIRNAAVCAESDRLCGKPVAAPRATGRARRGPG
ncbi:MAG TPA: hypothetical protein VF668_09830 [Pyrinomonadaceae bacterium]|jgi:hypothetical protein